MAGAVHEQIGEQVVWVLEQLLPGEPVHGRSDSRWGDEEPGDAGEELAEPVDRFERDAEEEDEVEQVGAAVAARLRLQSSYSGRVIRVEWTFRRGKRSPIHGSATRTQSSNMSGAIATTHTTDAVTSVG